MCKLWHPRDSYYYYYYASGDVLVMADACALPKRVAAIDFGTGFCSLAYTLRQDDEIAVIPLGFTYTPDSARVPTAVLLKKNPDCTLKIVKFGSPAQNEISKLSNEALGKYLYFECNLLHEAVSASSLHAVVLLKYLRRA